ncbi:MAG: hypothetical protein NTX53_18890, partial [candidate division WOR-3 bacterium]|nr:hypothetical protein [candidate division WOR-3 bacterium]
MRTTFAILLTIAGLCVLALAAPGGIPFPPGLLPADGNGTATVMTAVPPALFDEHNPKLAKPAIPPSSTPTEPGNAPLAGVPAIRWKSATLNAPWTARYYHANVEYDGKMWVLGGIFSQYYNDVWYSGDGSDWTEATGNALWSGRYGHEVVVFKDKMWLAGGNDNAGYMNDVWYSTDGVSWTCATASAPWERRAFFGFCVFNDKLWVIGGYNGGLFNDVWYSEDGVTWTCATSNVPWQGRGIHTTLTHDNRMWVLGGITWGNNRTAEVWNSSDGVSWTLATASPGWSARAFHTSVVFDGSTWVLGGYDNTMYRNDVWRSNDGVNWSLATRAADWPARFGHTSVVLNDRMWVIGGWGAGWNDVWYSEPPLPWDASTVQITAPTGDVVLGSRVTPKAIVANLGTNTADFPVLFQIGASYSSTKSVQDLAPGAELEVQFDEWTPQDPGQYDVSCRTQLTDDGDPRNDLQTGSVNVAPGMEWIQATASAPWPARHNAGVAVLENKLWVAGGYNNSGFLSDVWCSADGLNWTRTTDAAPWGGRYSLGCVAFEGKLWIIGGYSSGYRNDVWWSTDGVEWTQATPSAPWAPRFWHTCVVYDGRMWVIGGRTSDYSFENDVWYSSDGENWFEATSSAAWTPRQLHSSAVFDGRMWVVGGTGRNGLGNDVWSSTDGESWTQATNSAPWSARVAHASVAYDDQLWVIGGIDNQYGFRNDVWSSPNGADWEQFVGAQWIPRAYLGATVYQNRIWLLGGYDDRTYMGDVWYAPPGLTDMGVTSIDAPLGLVPPGAVTPMATVHNYGTLKAGFTTTFRINCTPPYEDIVTNDEGIEPGTDLQVSFTEHTLAEGNYTAECRTVLNGDNDPDNDVKTVDFAVAASGWSARASLPALPSGDSEGLGGWLAYDAGSGLIYAAKGEKTGDFYAFNPVTNTWEERASIPPYVPHKKPVLPD